jgi:hypothetical protein
LAAGNYPEAIRELKWCVGRAPDNQEVQQLLQTATREQLKSSNGLVRQ